MEAQFQKQIFEIGLAFRAAREAQGLTLQVVHEAIGFSAAYLSNIERGLRPHRLQTLQEIANYLKVDISEAMRALREDSAA